MVKSGVEIIIQITGPLTVRSLDGADLTPKSQKAKGLLALLVMAPGYRRTRTRLQDKLWSSREPEQGAASLRQALSEIRKAFGTAAACLKADRRIVSLDPQRVEIRTAAHDGEGPGTETPVLFEDLDIKDEEFEEWLRAQRQTFESGATSSPSDQKNRPQSDFIETARDEGPRLQLVMQPRPFEANARDRIIADNLTDLIARTVTELSNTEVIDLRNAGAPRQLLQPGLATVAVSADVAHDETGLTCRLALTSPGNHLLWSAAIRPKGVGLDKEDASVLRDLNQMVEQVFRQFQVAGQAQEQRIASILCRQGIERLFRLKKSDMLLADKLFEQAYEIEPRPIYLAWRGYLRTFMMVELIPNDRQALGEEALAFCRKAREEDPANSYVMSFAAHVFSIAKRSYVAAFDLAEQSVQLNPANPIGWGTLGIAECYLGKPDLGFEHTLRARDLCGTTPFRFFVNGQASIAGSMAGDIDGAIFLGEACHGLSPSYKPPLRFLSALYLLRDRYHDSQTMVEKLRLTEPTFSYDLLRDPAYPASSLHRSGLLTKLPQRQI